MYDAFISHASEEKDSFVRPLAEILNKLGLSIWYDEFALKVGDSLSRSIDKGLLESKYGIIVISANFLNKKWPEREYRGLVAKEIEEGKVILPVWYKIAKKDVMQFSPILADYKAINADDMNIDKVALQLIEVIKPDLFEKILRRLAFSKLRENAKIGEVDANIVVCSPRIHKELPKSLNNRIRLIRNVLFDVDPHSFRFWQDGFLRDSHPSNEVYLWEKMCNAYLEYKAIYSPLDDEKKDVLSFLLYLSNGLPPNETEYRKYAIYTTKEKANTLIKLMSSDIPIFDMEDEYEMQIKEGTSDRSKWDKEYFEDLDKPDEEDML